MANFDEQTRRTLFWGLMRAQLGSLVIAALLASLFAGVTVGMAAAWGGLVSLTAYAWGGFQVWMHPVWMHPGNRLAKHMAGAAVKAEVGKIVIMLALFWLTFANVPQMRELTTGAVLLLSFLAAQIAGWVQIARLETRLAMKSSRARQLD